MMWGVLDGAVAEHGVGMGHQVIEIGFVGGEFVLECCRYFLSIDGEGEST